MFETYWSTDVLGEPGNGELELGLAGCRQTSPAGPLGHHKEAVVPGRVVPHVRIDAFLAQRELGLPLAKLLHEPLAVRPGMVVLGLHTERLAHKLEVGGHR